ncbi:MAG TPA: hypothetical protein VG387_04770 [Rhizomicrobium sp.]|nr:hypothetical protein [Rhizomicrobium sp.]
MIGRIGLAALVVLVLSSAGSFAGSPIITERVNHCALQRFSSGVQARFCATSVLTPQRDAAGRPATYGPEHLFDGNPATAWCEGVPGPGNGQQIQIAFSRPQVVKAITFINGYARSGEAITRANSIRTLDAVWPDGTMSSIAIPDRREPFTFMPDHKGAVVGFTLRIDQVNGSKWPDTCLTEVRLSLATP